MKKAKWFFCCSSVISVSEKLNNVKIKYGEDNESHFRLTLYGLLILKFNAMIGNLSFHSLRRNEHYTFGTRVLGILQGYDLEALQLKPINGRISASVMELDEALVKANTKLLTKTVGGADKNRDNGFLAIRYVLVGYSKRLNPQWNEAANLLLEVIRSYGWSLHLENNATETSLLENMISDFETKPKLKAAVELLGLGDMLAELKQSQADFEGTVQARTEEKASISEVKTIDACAKVRKSCELLFQYINMTQELNPNDDFASLTRLINEVIDEFNTSIKLRKSKPSKDDESSSEENPFQEGEKKE